MVAYDNEYIYNEYIQLKYCRNHKEIKLIFYRKFIKMNCKAMNYSYFMVHVITIIKTNGRSFPITHFVQLYFGWYYLL